MKKVILYVDERFGETAIIGLAGKGREDIMTFTFPLEHENEFKIRKDGKVADMKKIQGNDNWDD